MKKALVLFFGLAFMLTSGVAYAAGEVQDTPLYGKSLTDAKRFDSGDGGIQPRYVKGADEAQQEYPWPTLIGTYTCAVAFPTCVEYPTCCWEGFTCLGVVCTPTLDYSPTCEGGATCAGSFTCGSANFTCQLDLECEPTATMYGFLTCGWWPTCWMGPTCDGLGTCADSWTCGGHLTCNRYTTDSHPTCGPKPTCGGNTCWPVCTPTFAPQITCEVGFTCVIGAPTCEVGIPTCDFTCSDQLHTCQAAPTCWAGEECDHGDSPTGVPGLSPIGTAVLILSLASLIVLYMYKRKRAEA